MVASNRSTIIRNKNGKNYPRGRADHPCPLADPKARDFPVPAELGKNDLSYIAGVKDLLRQARDLVKFIPKTAGVSVEMKEEVKKIYEEAEQANREILY